MSRWTRIASISCLPTLKNGCSEDSGSWKIIAMSLPRILRSWSSFIWMRSLPSNSIFPSTWAPWVRVSPSVVSEETVLPEPDSPTIPSVLPVSIE